MNRNTEQIFSMAPSVDIKRSKFDKSHSFKFTCNVGELIPVMWDEVLPGDTWSIDTSKVIRLQTMLTPVMDNLFADFYWFFVPNRLVWNHWKEFMGENSESAWAPTTQYSVPVVDAPASTGWNIGTIADYLGIPTGVAGISPIALPFRAYALIVDQWFRSEALQNPVNVPVGDSDQTGVNTGNYVTDLANGGLPFIANKTFDLFTGCLPGPQRGDAVQIPVATPNPMPVLPGDEIDLSNWSDQAGLNVVYKGTNTYTGQEAVQYGYGRVYNQGAGISQANSLFDNEYTYSAGFKPINLYAFGDGNATAVSINQLRLAFQLQKLLERDARSGGRYIEVIRSHFGVTSPDARQQRAEYLGGNRFPLHVNQIVQQSGTASGTTPQGTPVGLSLTTDKHSDFTKSFTEHGILMCLMCVRYDHTYSQGLELKWNRSDRYSYYWPVLANIGEQPVPLSAIYAQGTTDDDLVFGYQQAWPEYRYSENRVAGEMRSSATTSLDVWHLGDDYSSAPSLSDTWLQEDKANVDRVLAVTSSVSNQVFGDIYFKATAVRPMPVYSIPGLIDHH